MKYRMYSFCYISGERYILYRVRRGKFCRDSSFNKESYLRRICWKVQKAENCSDYTKIELPRYRGALAWGEEDFTI